MAFPAYGADVPFYLRALDNQRDVGGINENFRSLADSLTKTRTDLDAATAATTAAAAAAAVSRVDISTFSQNVTVATIFNAATMGPCVSGSTLTLSLAHQVYSTATAMIQYTGDASSSLGDETVKFGVLVDGAYPPGLSETVGISRLVIVTSPTAFNPSFLFPVTLSTGTHTYCTTFARTNGNVSVPSTQGKFGVWQLR